MGLLMFDAFTTRDLQLLIHFLQVAETSDIKDVSTLRDFAARDLQKRFVELNRMGRAGKRTMRRCPSCGRGVMVQVYNPDGLKIVGCKVCRYSEVR